MVSLARPAPFRPGVATASARYKAQRRHLARTLQASDDPTRKRGKCPATVSQPKAQALWRNAWQHEAQITQ